MTNRNNKKSPSSSPVQASKKRAASPRSSPSLSDAERSPKKKHCTGSPTKKTTKPTSFRQLFKDIEQVSGSPKKPAAARRRLRKAGAAPAAAAADNTDMEDVTGNDNAVYGQIETAEEGEKEDEEDAQSQAPVPKRRSRASRRTITASDEEMEDAGALVEDAAEEAEDGASDQEADEDADADAQDGPPIDIDEDEDEDDDDDAEEDDAEQDAIDSDKENTPPSTQPTRRLRAGSARNSTPAPAARSTPRASGASTASATSTPQGSPVKPRAWTTPVGAGVYTSGNGGVIPANAKQYDVKVLLVGDLGMAMNSGTRVARKYVLLLNMREPENSSSVMVLVGYADDATKYMANLEMNKCYTLDLLTRAQADGKQLCIPDQKVYYKLAPNTKIRPYVAPGQNKRDDLSLAVSQLSIQSCNNIFTGVIFDSVLMLADSDPDDIVHVRGIVMSITSVTLKFSVGTRIQLADGEGYITVMFFEGKPNLKVGSTLTIIGGRVWLNPKTGAKELSIYSTSLIATGAIKASSTWLDRCRKQEYRLLTNVSRIPMAEPCRMAEVVKNARDLESEIDCARGTVKLRMDPFRPSQNGTMTYNGCSKCRKKVKPLDESDADGNQLFDHDNENAGPSHKSVSYMSYYYFTGRFVEENDDTAHLFQVNDDLGRQLFHCTAEQMTEMSDVDQAATLKRGVETLHTYNVTVSKSGDVQAMLFVE